MASTLRVAAFAALLALPLATQARAANPVEGCTHKSWGFLTFNNRQFGTVNTCGYAVSVWFMRANGSTVHAVVPSGGFFDTGLRREEFDDSVWSAAICRAGMTPSPSVDLAHWDQILNGDYRCVRE